MADLVQYGLIVFVAIILYKNIRSDESNFAYFTTLILLIYLCYKLDISVLNSIISVIALIIVFCIVGNHIRKYKEDNRVDKDYYENGKLKRITPHKNGKQHGVNIRYFEDGKTVWGETPYENGERHGIKKVYYTNGQLEREESYEHGQPNGIWRKFYTNGCSEYEKTYKGRSYLHGPYKEYYDNGKLKTDAIYKDNERDSFYREYYRNGFLAGQSFYVRGAKRETEKYYHHNGVMALIATYTEEEDPSYNDDYYKIITVNFKIFNSQGEILLDSKYNYSNTTTLYEVRCFISDFGIDHISFEGYNKIFFDKTGMIISKVMYDRNSGEVKKYDENRRVKDKTKRKYSMLENAKGEIMIMVDGLCDNLDNPRLIYDGGDIALLYQSPESSRCLKNLSPRAQERLKFVSEVLIVEIEDDDVVREYSIPVRMVRNVKNLITS